jgi:hypothetical protein
MKTEGFIRIRVMMNLKVMVKTIMVNAKKMKSIFLDMLMSALYQGRIKPIKIK